MQQACRKNKFTLEKKQNYEQIHISAAHVYFSGDKLEIDFTVISSSETDWNVLNITNNLFSQINMTFRS